ncbi:hypothetical protein [Streptomyces sp. NPDC023588]
MRAGLAERGRRTSARLRRAPPSGKELQVAGLVQEARHAALSG